MKIKTAELIGPALDWAVAKCLGAPTGKPKKCTDCRFYEERSGPDGGLDYCSEGEWRELEFWGGEIGADYGVHSSCELKDTAAYPYSTDWAQGGPIKTREKISTVCKHDGWWVASKQYNYADEPEYVMLDEDELVAAMRCYVASKLGDEVDVPEELV